MILYDHVSKGKFGPLSNWPFIQIVGIELSGRSFGPPRFQWLNNVIWASLQFHFLPGDGVPGDGVGVELQGYMRFNWIEILVLGWVHSTVLYQIKITLSDSFIVRNWFIGGSINDCWFSIDRKGISRVMHQWIYIIFLSINFKNKTVLKKNRSLIRHFKIPFLIWLMFWYWIIKQKGAPP